MDDSNVNRKWLCRLCGEEFDTFYERNSHEATHFQHEVSFLG